MSSPAPQFRSRMPRIAEAAVERVRLTVVPRTRSHAPRVPFVTLVTLVLLGGVVGLLLFNTSMQQASFASTELEEQATNLDAREQTLQMELDGLRDPQRVAQRAHQLGMVQPGSPAFLVLGSGKVLGDPTPATGDERLHIAPYAADKPTSLDPTPTVVEVAPPAHNGDDQKPAHNTRTGSVKHHDPAGSNGR
ncbi:MAG TPA: hypothetical protein VGJ41_16645 [Nocardioides sp.]